MYRRVVHARLDALATQFFPDAVSRQSLRQHHDSEVVRGGLVIPAVCEWNPQALDLAQQPAITINELGSCGVRLTNAFELHAADRGVDLIHAVVESRDRY